MHIDKQLVKNDDFVTSDKMTMQYLRLRSVRQIANSMQSKSLEEQKIENEIRKRIKKSITSHQDRFFQCTNSSIDYWKVLSL